MKKFLGFLTTNTPSASRYAEEVLAHAGLFASPIAHEELAGVAAESLHA